MYENLTAPIGWEAKTTWSYNRANNLVDVVYYRRHGARTWHRFRVLRTSPERLARLLARAVALRERRAPSDPAPTCAPVADGVDLSDVERWYLSRHAGTFRLLFPWV